MSHTERIDTGLWGINAELLNVMLRCVKNVFRWMMIIFKLPLENPHTLMYHWRVSLRALTQLASVSAAFYIHWFWFIRHLWLLKTQRRPLGGWSGFWVLKPVQPRCSASLHCVSSLAAVAHLAERWLTTPKRTQKQCWMCDLCTFASQQRSYS